MDNLTNNLNCEKSTIVEKAERILSANRRHDSLTKMNEQEHFDFDVPWRLRGISKYIFSQLTLKRKIFFFDNDRTLFRKIFGRDHK